MIEIPETPTEIIYSMSNLFEFGVPTPGRLAITGQEYLVITSSGIKPEGEAKKFYETKDEACIRFWMALLKYSKVREASEKPYIYLRRLPELTGYEGRWSMECRLLVSQIYAASQFKAVA